MRHSVGYTTEHTIRHATALRRNIPLNMQCICHEHTVGDLMLLHTHNIRMCEIDIGNPKYKTFTKLVQVRNFITFELKVIRHEERETQSFYADCFYSCPKPRAAFHLQTTGLASAGPESQSSRSDAGTQLTAFSQIPQILSPRFRCMKSFTPPGHISSLGFFFDICE